MDDVLAHDDHYECSTCGHEWERERSESTADADVARVVKDAVGNVLADGDTVTLINDLTLRGSSEVLKQGAKVKNIRLVDGDHEIDCKIRRHPDGAQGDVRQESLAGRVAIGSRVLPLSTTACGASPRANQVFRLTS
jgi:protein PhnA